MNAIVLYKLRQPSVSQGQTHKGSRIFCQIVTKLRCPFNVAIIHQILILSANRIKTRPACLEAFFLHP